MIILRLEKWGFIVKQINAGQFFSMYAPVLSFEERGIFWSLAMLYEANGKIIMAEQELKNAIGYKRRFKNPERDHFKNLLKKCFTQVDGGYLPNFLIEGQRPINTLSEQVETKEDAKEDSVNTDETLLSDSQETNEPEEVQVFESMHKAVGEEYRYFEQWEEGDDINELLKPPKNFAHPAFYKIDVKCRYKQPAADMVEKRLTDFFNSKEYKGGAKSYRTWLEVYKASLIKHAERSQDYDMCNWYKDYLAGKVAFD